ncbi:MAG TPA: FHA domain-containing protein [Pseudomonadota bacterium]|nr:FHA domain-containing protein [Rhodanobacteraceae bacterium]MBP9154979.1 FHA domain-containing protein [Xanthomonadales bacterium]HQW82355.1 FHA domain-containing protein [Pseudomonadota bacterium]
MKLLFPNGEHEPFELKLGTTRVGGGAGNDLLLMAPGIAAQHCELTFDGSNGTIRVLNAANSIALNGRQVMAETPIKPGDIVLFGKIGIRVLASERMQAAAAAAKKEPEDDGRTRVRQALPRYVLRGVSGSTFGKTFALVGTMTVGRAAECDISIPTDEVSRQHAKLQVMPDGIAVEDMGSANGTFINDKRVHTGMLKPGEELRLDTVRFMLVAPHLEMQQVAKAAEPAAAKSAPVASGGGQVKWLVIGLVGAGTVIAALWAAGIMKF